MVWAVQNGASGELGVAVLVRDLLARVFCEPSGETWVHRVFGAVVEGGRSMTKNNYAALKCRKKYFAGKKNGVNLCIVH